MNLEIAILVLIVLAMRLVPRMLMGSIIPSSDTFFHLRMSNFFYQKRKIMPMEWQGLDGHGYYPYFYHLLMGLFGTRWQLFFEVASSPVFDLINTILVYFYTDYLVDVVFPGVLMPNTALWVAILYSTSFSMFQGESGPRSLEGTPRTLGELLFLLMVMLLIAPGFFGLTPGISFLASLLVGGLMFLTSKFSVQACVFMFMGASFLQNDFRLMLIPFLVFIISMIISRGAYWRILRLQIAHLKVFSTRIQFGQRMFFNRNNIFYITEALVSGIRNRDLKLIYRTLRYDFTFASSLYRCPQFFFALAIIAGMTTCDLPGGTSLQVYEHWILASLFVYLVTSFLPFIFLGEPERYPEYSLFPQYLLIVAACRLPVFLVVIFLAQMAFYGFFVYSKFRRVSRAKTSSEKIGILVQQLLKIDPARKLLFIGFTSLWEILYNLEKHGDERSLMPDQTNRDCEMATFCPKITNIIEPPLLNQFIKEKNIDMCVVNRDWLNQNPDQYGDRYDFSGFTMDAVVDSYEFYSCQKR